MGIIIDGRIFEAPKGITNSINFKGSLHISRTYWIPERSPIVLILDDWLYSYLRERAYTGESFPLILRHEQFFYSAWFKVDNIERIENELHLDIINDVTMQSQEGRLD